MVGSRAGEKNSSLSPNVNSKLHDTRCRDRGARMKNGRFSRRRFAVMAGTAGALGLLLEGAGPLTAEAVVRRIQTELGGDWPSAGPDGFKAGDPSVVVKGIATTAMATLDVLKQAVSMNANLILTYEPTFSSRS